jgi:predicted nucleic-acid-binding protein
MRAIDTNVLLRLIVHDDVNQTKRAKDFVQGGAWVSHVVLAEAVWVLRSVYGLDQARAAGTIASLLNHSVLVLQDAEVVGRALDMYASNKRVSFTDCLIAQVAAKAGHTPLGSFDKAMAALEGVESI